VLDHLRAHADPQIRAAALATSGRIGYHRDALVAALSDPDARVRAAAFVALAKDPDHAPAIARGVTQLLEGSRQDRLALANAIAFVPDLTFRPLLYELLACGEFEVMRVVLHVLERVPALAELDRLVPLLANAQVRDEVRRVLLAVGSRALEQLIATLDDPETPLAVRRHLPRTISRFHTHTAAAALVARLPHEPDHRTTYKLLRALGRLRADDPTLEIDPAPVREYVHRAVRDAARYARFADRLRVEIGTTTASTALILELLVEKRRIALELVFRGLGILYPRAGLRSVHDALTGDDEARRSAAREILEAAVPADIRVPLLAVIDGQLVTEPQPDYESVMTALLADPSESLRCVVAHHVADRNLVGLREELARLRPIDGPPLVRNAFDQAIERLHA
jgi:HEAT repeat protein